MAEFEKSQRIVGINESGYQNDPQDSGNYYMGNLIGTNYGISAPTLAGYLGRIPSKAEMQNLSHQTAEKILKVNFWLKNNFDKLQNQSVATLIYDGAVNHGNSAMRILIEKALRLLNRPINQQDIFTLKGISTLNRLNQKQLFSTVKRVRTDKYNQSKEREFLEGWLNRLERIHYYPNNTISGIWPYAALVCVGIGLILIIL